MARDRVAQLCAQRQDLPKRVEVRDLERAGRRQARYRTRAPDPDIIKMVAYQAESDLLALLRPHYARADQEGRVLLHELFATAGESASARASCTSPWLRSARRIEPTPPKPSVRSSTRTATIFPGSHLRIRFAVRPRPRIGLAFPGSPAERSTATAVAPAP